MFNQAPLTCTLALSNLVAGASVLPTPTNPVPGMFTQTRAPSGKARIVCE